MTNIFGDNTKKLGFGLMRLPRLDPNKEDSSDVETLKKMVKVWCLTPMWSTSRQLKKNLSGF